MKNTILAIVATTILLPSFAFASFDQNLSYGMAGSDVYQLQDILISDGCLTHASTGYFGLLTLNAVKCYQAKNGLPSTGYVGTLTRGVLNTVVAYATASSTQEAIVETGTSTVSSSNTLQVMCPVGFNCIPQTQQKNTASNPVNSTQTDTGTVAMGIPQQNTATITLTQHCGFDQSLSTSTAVTFYSIDTSGAYGSYQFTSTETYPDGTVTRPSDHGNSPMKNTGDNNDRYKGYSFVLGGALGATMNYNFNLYSGQTYVDDVYTSHPSDTKFAGNVVGTASGSVTFQPCSL